LHAYQTLVSLHSISKITIWWFLV